MGFVARTLSVLFCVSLLASCGKQAIKPDAFNILQNNHGSPEYINQLLSQALETKDTEESLSLQLDAAELLANSGDTDWARSIIHNLSSHTNPLYVDSQLISARKALVTSYIYAADGYSPLAYENINADALLFELPTLPSSITIPILELRAKLLFNMGHYSSSIDERIKLSAILQSDSPENEQNQDLIWTALMDIPMESLERLAQASRHREQLGWYTLASMSKNNQTNLRQQLKQVEQWILEWPEHPASLRPPADLQILQQLLDEQPQNIALLLPSTGRLSGAGNAIKDGFMAAYYELKDSNSGTAPTLRFYDSNTDDIVRLYDDALADGAELIIGPLSKANMKKLASQNQILVPTLALNTIDDAAYAQSNFYQFGLGVEDEAELAAHKAWRDGHRRALIITPNTSWGDRATQAFEFTWIGLGGEICKDYRFEDTNDYSKIIKHAFQLDQSHQRSREIRRIVGHIEFEPRRRQDVDMIFLAAQSAQARQVKPTLAFHYAGKIPVYATSHIYSGAPSPKLDQDMNGVRFSTLPWFFDAQSPEKQSLNTFGTRSPNLQPLFALGVDSFHLYPRLKQLEEVVDARFYGKTGQLLLNKNRQIRRKQVWAEFHRGRVRPLTDIR